MQLPHASAKATPVFDDENLVSCPGPAPPVMGLRSSPGCRSWCAESVTGPRPRDCSRSGGHHPFLTNSDEPTAAADITHRRHAIIETVFADLIDGPLAHLPSGRFAANSAWAICAAITHNLLRAAGTLAGPRLAVARGATLRRQIVNVPARIADPQRRKALHLLAHWPWADHWTALWTAVFPVATGPPAAT